MNSNSKNYFLLVLSIVIFNVQLNSQSLVLEGGLSKHFVPKAGEYEQPNLHLKLKHNVSDKIEYQLNYYYIKTYWPYIEHTITPWQGDENELYSRKIHGIDLNFNIIPLFHPDTNFGFNIGPTVRRRHETWFELCQYTSDGWMECFLYSETLYDIGLNFEINYQYFIWEKLGLGIGLIERICDSGPPSFSINGGVVYKFNYDNKKSD